LWEFDSENQKPRALRCFCKTHFLCERFNTSTTQFIFNKFTWFRLVIFQLFFSWLLSQTHLQSSEFDPPRPLTNLHPKFPVERLKNSLETQANITTPRLSIQKLIIVFQKIFPRAAVTRLKILFSA
jgi:hypothetical protein